MACGKRSEPVLPAHGRRPVTATDIDREVVELIRHQSLIEDLSIRVMESSYLEKGCVRMLDSKGRVGQSLTGQVLSKEGYVVPVDYCVSPIEMQDLGRWCNEALEAACMAMDNPSIPARSEGVKSYRGFMHHWGYQRAAAGIEPGDSESRSVLNMVKPILQESLQKPRGIWDSANGIDGPLTWRSLERKCFRGSGQEDECQPEPIPHVTLTTEKDSVLISPLALRLWERLMLEPYGPPKDVVYVVVIPDNHFVLNRAKTFFRELSKVYENFRFGRHCPFTKVLVKDGILVVGPNAELCKTVQKSEVDNWFDGPQLTAEGQTNKSKLRAYAQVCQHALGSLLQQGGAFDRQIFRDVDQPNESMPPPPAPQDPGSEPNQAPANGNEIPPDPEPDGDQGSGALPHAVVIYLVNPVVFGPENKNSRLARVSFLALLRCYLHIVHQLPDHLRSYLQLEVVPLQTVLDYTADLAEEANTFGPAHQGSGGAAEAMRRLAVSVYSRARTLSSAVTLSTQAKCLTGFGPASAFFQTIHSLLNGGSKRLFKLNTPPFVLARSGPQRGVFQGSRESAPSTQTEEDAVLFVSYCLSEQQDWMFVTATDQLGTMLESALVNLVTLDDRRAARQDAMVNKALERLWQFVIGALATACKPWRLVVGKLGRLGHTELKAWAHLLGKPNVRRTSFMLRDQCGQCAQMPSFHETPALLSACLVSVEPEPTLRLFPTSFEPDERFGLGAKHCPLRTPDDVSATHILVFPTSATVQFSSNARDEGVDMFNLILDNDDPENRFIEDLFLSDPGGPGPVPQSARSGPPGSAFMYDFAAAGPLELSQQPLALGYYISTAPAPGLPAWFWASCPAARRRQPVHLKAALHLHTPKAQESDDVLADDSKKKAAEQAHPLDSRLNTTDVLRYVLETYNALSWLGLDLSTGQRRSCLPVHIQALLRLYHGASALLDP